VKASGISMDVIMEEVIALSTNMCRADAEHSNAIIEIIQNFRARCLLLLNELGDKMRQITDRESVESCKRTFKKVVDEVRKVSLAVPTESVIKSDSTNPSHPMTSVMRQTLIVSQHHSAIFRLEINCFPCMPFFLVHTL
jgi:hypothetical protein